ncbi:hypothetical protein G5V58_15430 [Nocardioides anomalus]|uniref:GlsB/YeaQ/YmgE family stress response membrane protein n=1 Tax=Nocardioides anomalus TaxID=2712223 RepID=A0A6G6WFP2_9ACTN|nr:hypothetical protein [Nocardioides anomalus]QIG43977.1 hypothetical protein G5V58_15430 [Nocardioides anomalus]
MVGTILWALIGGAVIGILGKWAAPGDRDIPLYATVLCGVGGVFLGNWLYVDVLGFRAQTFGIDWWRHIWQVAVAALLVVGVTSLRRPRRRV